MNTGMQDAFNLAWKLALAPVQYALADNLTEVAIGYPESPLNGPSQGGAGLRPGERVVPVASQAPIGSGDAPRFALFADKSSATADLLRQFAALLDPDIRPPLREGSIWLVRPDGYVAARQEMSRSLPTISKRLKSLSKRLRCRIRTSQ
jgi:hypothetical protein